MTSMSEDACDDLEGLDASATHVANLLTGEPDDGMSSSYYTSKSLGFNPRVQIICHCSFFKLKQSIVMFPKT